jgi:hypothetical protein
MIVGAGACTGFLELTPKEVIARLFVPIAYATSVVDVHRRHMRSYSGECARFPF